MSNREIRWHPRYRITGIACWKCRVRGGGAAIVFCLEVQWQGGNARVAVELRRLFKPPRFARL